MQKTLIFKDNFQNFGEFFENSRDLIYNNIILILEDLKINKEVISHITVIGKIDNLDWKSDIPINVYDKEKFFKEFLNYYENKEDFEMCNKIMILQKDLTM